MKWINVYIFRCALSWLLWLLCHTDPAEGPIYMSKYDFTNGFYQIFLAADDTLKLAVMIPRYDGEPQCVAMPLSLTMGWTNLPSMLSAASKPPISQMRSCTVASHAVLYHCTIWRTASTHDSWDLPGSPFSLTRSWPWWPQLHHAYGSYAHFHDTLQTTTWKQAAITDTWETCGIHGHICGWLHWPDPRLANTLLWHKKIHNAFLMTKCSQNLVKRHRTGKKQCQKGRWTKVTVAGTNAKRFWVGSLMHTKGPWNLPIRRCKGWCKYLWTCETRSLLAWRSGNMCWGSSTSWEQPSLAPLASSEQCNLFLHIWTSTECESHLTCMTISWTLRC